MTGRVVLRVRRRIAFSIPLLLALSLASLALGLAGKHGPGKIGRSKPDWPQALVELVDSERRVAGHWVNANDEFFYEGDTAAFNEFLKTYAKLTGTPLRVIIHAGTRRRSRLWAEAPENDYDWKLLILTRGWGAPQTPGFDGKHVVTVDVWVDRGVELEKIYGFGPIAPLVAPENLRRSR